ncbi:hypothetical protein AOLI_G00036590 [Acnodon oligacanthus]
MIQLKAENEALKRDLDAFKTSVVNHMSKLLRTMERLDTWLETKGQSPQPQLPSPSSIQETLEIHPGHPPMCLLKPPLHYWNGVKVPMSGPSKLMKSNLVSV